MQVWSPAIHGVFIFCLVHVHCTRYIMCLYCVPLHCMSLLYAHNCMMKMCYLKNITHESRRWRIHHPLSWEWLGVWWMTLNRVVSTPPHHVISRIHCSSSRPRQIMSRVTLRALRHPPPSPPRSFFFVDSWKTATRSATKFGRTIPVSFLHTMWK